jgi:hypothetical protein
MSGSTYTDGKAATADPAEEAVRRYLLHLTDPQSLIDHGLIEVLKKRLAEETDVVARLKGLAAIESLENVDESALRKEFVRHARSYAEREDIPATAFASMGVPRDVLGEAGLLNRGRRQATPHSPGRTRVGREQIIATVPENEFTVRDLEAASGANSITVRKVIDEMVAGGQLTELGPDPEYQGKGRAPKRYKRS